MRMSIPACQLGALLATIGFALLPIHEARADWDGKGISAAECQPYPPTTSGAVVFKDNAIYNTTSSNQRVICPVNKDYAGEWTFDNVQLIAYFQAGDISGRIACTLYGGGTVWGESQIAYTVTSIVAKAGVPAQMRIDGIADPVLDNATIEGWNVMCILNSHVSLGGFYFAENYDTDRGN